MSAATRSAGVSLGAHTPYQESNAKLGRPLSLNVGISGARLLRRDDVSMDNDPWMEGTAQVWVPLASQRTAPPRVGGTPTTRAVGAGQGDRTVDICVTHTFAGVESEPGKVSTLTMGDAQDLRIALPALSNQTGLYRRIYWRAPEHGVYAWRR